MLQTDMMMPMDRPISAQNHSNMHELRVKLMHDRKLTADIIHGIITCPAMVLEQAALTAGIAEERHAGATSTSLNGSTVSASHVYPSKQTYQLRRAQLQGCYRSLLT